MRIVLAALLALAAAAGAQAAPILSQPDPDSPIGARNPDGPEGLAQYDFLIGDWDVEITYRPPGGEPLTYPAKWHNVWAVDGFVVMQEWRGPYATGAELRSYDPETDSWSGVNMYAGKPPKLVTARREGDEMIVRAPDVVEDDAGFISREIYHDITADSFAMRQERSTDGGATWEPGAYEMTVTRSAP